MLQKPAMKASLKQATYKMNAVDPLPLLAICRIHFLDNRSAVHLNDMGEYLCLYKII